MRVLLNVEMDTEAGNRQIESGSMEKVMQEILGALKPEAAYFYPKGGRRAMTLVVDMTDSAAIPSLVEPFWLKLNAHVEAYPCMNGDELGEGLSRMH